MFECDRAPPWIGSGVGGWVMCVVERASRTSSLIVPRGRDISSFFPVLRSNDAIKQRRQWRLPRRQWEAMTLQSELIERVNRFGSSREGPGRRLPAGFPRFGAV